MNTKTFNNNIRAYIQHLRYSLQVIGMLFAEQLMGQQLYGMIKIEMVEGPDEAMKKQEARVQLQQMAPLISSDEDKRKLLLAQCAIENDNEYLQNFAQSLQPMPTLNELQLGEQMNNANQLLMQKDQQIAELQKQIEQLQIEQKMNAYSLDRESLLSRQKFEQDKEMKILEYQLAQQNPAELAKTEAEVEKAQLGVAKEEISLQKEVEKANQPQVNIVKGE